MSNSRLFNILFPAKSLKIKQYDLYKKLVPELHEKLKTLERENEIIKKVRDSIYDVLIENTDNIISIHRTHKDFDIILAYHFYESENPVLIMKIWHVDNYKKTGHDLLLNARILKDGKTVIIEDITSIEFNKGLGQSAVLKLIEISRNRGCNVLIGDLGREDIETHGERLLHFYQKLGFSIEMRDNQKLGKIELKI